MDLGRLSAESFSLYLPQGRVLAVSYLDTLRHVPLALLSSLLLQIRRYDTSFPMERTQLESELSSLKALSPESFGAATRAFATLSPPPELVRMDWVNQPQQFTERLTAWLWSQHRIDDYHAATERYRKAVPLIQSQPITSRWTIVMIGRDAPSLSRPLFRKLAPYGTLFTNVNPGGGTEALLAEASARAAKYPAAYAHWYIDGSEPLPAPRLTTVSYQRLVPAARKEFQLLRRFTETSARAPASTVESATSYVTSLTPDDLEVSGPSTDPLRFFDVSILTQGAGCQIFSTTFVQWAARECLHRAQPLTLVARFSSRQAAAPMEQLLNRDPLAQTPDTSGSVVDADMGAYYTWINQSRLPGSDQSRFLAWWEGHDLACLISPSTTQGVTSSSPCSMAQILAWIR